MANQAIPPLAARMQPRDLSQFFGQKHILGQNKILSRIIISGRIPSLLFFGPPGSGKTALGFILANKVKAEFVYLNAAFTSSSKVKKILIESRLNFEQQQRPTVLFIDEIHRFNKLQQESLLLDTAAGSVIFIGATIYNPYYHLISSLTSRVTVINFNPLSVENIKGILKNALTDKQRGLGAKKVKITDKAVEHLAVMASGDARKALNSLEIGILSTQPDQKGEIFFDYSVAEESIQKNLVYDKKDGNHYDTISAFIKAVRGSDPDSALYWLAKMLISGEDPRFIARRLIILASEDIGNANPAALPLAVSCFQAVEVIGMPEAKLPLAQAAIFLACSPKSNSIYKAINAAYQDFNQNNFEPVPDNLKTNSKTYKYPHLYPTGRDVGGYVRQNYGAKKKYYFPLDVGDEKKIKNFLAGLKDI